MIMPVQPFSVTGIEMDGFDPKRAYPVFAIDIDTEDQPADEKKKTADDDGSEVGIFLVPDDSGSFAWVRENECKFYRSAQEAPVRGSADTPLTLRNNPVLIGHEKGRACPYCSETLDMPRPPRFCPHCGSRL